MKKYLMTGITALAFCGLFTSCTHDMTNYVGDKSGEIKRDYENKFIERFGTPAPDQEWGFGTTTAASRAGSRAVPGITFPDADDFSDKTDIPEPDVIEMPSITESDATIVYTESETVQSINNDNTIYVKSGVTLTIDNPWSDVSLERVNIYLESGSSLVIGNNRNLYIKSNSNIVNDGGSIIVGDESNKKDIVLQNFTGTFWNNGTINYVKDLKTENGEGGNIYLGSDTELNATNITLFKSVLFRNEGDIILTGKFNADQYGHKIYNSGTIKTPEIILQKETVLWNEGTITTADNEEIKSSISNNDVQIYNGEDATLKLENLNLTNNRQLVVNEGVLNVEGPIAIENNSEIKNCGTLTGSSMQLKSGAKFYNESGNTVTISGLTKIYNNSQNNVGNVWQNAGQFNTGSFEITGGVAYPAAFNNCHMTVTGQFFMNEGFFVLDGGAAVECGSFKWESNNYFHMGGKALLKVEGQLLANNQNNSPQYGFWGDDTEEYAVIKAGSVEKGSKGKCRAAYYGKLFIDTDNHFTQGENSADGTWYIFDDDVKFSFTDDTDVSHYQTEGAKTAQKAEDFSIDIPADTDEGCSPGYHYGEEDTETIRVIAEDLSVRDANADFDFNDVVFDVIWNKTQNKVSVKLLAAGGELTMYVGGTEDGVAGVQPVNSLFQLANPDKTIGEKDMLNTDPGRHNEYKPYTYELADSWWSGENIHAIAQSIYVRVIKNNELVTLEAIKGRAASKIAVGTDYDWCDERQDIDKKYPSNDPEKGKFSQYVGGMYTWDTWYK